MSILQSYPKGTPKKGDYIIGTSIPPVDSDEMPTTRNFTVSSIAGFANPTAAYTVYTAALVQYGEAAPVATVLQNTTGGTFSWGYESPGKFQIVVSGITFPANKVAIFMSPSTGDLGLGGRITTTTNIDVEQFTSGGGGWSDGMEAGTSIEIRIYS